MKQRHGYVSNSSSSSFVVYGVKLNTIEELEAALAAGRNVVMAVECGGSSGDNGETDIKEDLKMEGQLKEKRVDDIGDVQDTEAKVELVKKQDDVKLTGVSQRRLDDIGTTRMPDKFNIKQETRKSDLKKGIDLKKKPLDPVKVDRLREKKGIDLKKKPLDPVKVDRLREKKDDDIGEEINGWKLEEESK